jgi:hypothetical protein
MIPTLYSSGIYTITAPFNALLSNAALRLTCLAIRSFEDIYNEGEDVFTRYYQPAGVEESVFKSHAAAKVSIITLAKENGEQIHVPDVYLTNAPTGSSVPYVHTVLSISLGNIPEGLNLAFLITQLQNVTSDVIGKEATVAVHVAPTTDGVAVTPAQHASLETARNAAIELRETDYAKNLRLQQTIDTQMFKIGQLQQIIIDNDLLP